MSEAVFCAECGGNDETPPDHTMDCSHASNAPLPWSYRQGHVHFYIEAANGVRIATVPYVGRPDGSTSESEAKRVVAAINGRAQLLAELSHLAALPDHASPEYVRNRAAAAIARAETAS